MYETRALTKLHSKIEDENINIYEFNKFIYEFNFAYESLNESYNSTILEHDLLHNELHRDFYNNLIKLFKKSYKKVYHKNNEKLEYIDLYKKLTMFKNNQLFLDEYLGEIDLVIDYSLFVLQIYKWVKTNKYNKSILYDKINNRIINFINVYSSLSNEYTYNNILGNSLIKVLVNCHIYKKDYQLPVLKNNYLKSLNNNEKIENEYINLSNKITEIESDALKASELIDKLYISYNKDLLTKRFLKENFLIPGTLISNINQKDIFKNMYDFGLDTILKTVKINYMLDNIYKDNTSEILALKDFNSRHSYIIKNEKLTNDNILAIENSIKSYYQLKEIFKKINS